MRERDGPDEARRRRSDRDAAAEALDTGEEGDELWGLVLEAARLDEVVEQVVRSLELSVIAKYAFGLAQAFNAFYHRQQILQRGARRRRALARGRRGVHARRN